VSFREPTERRRHDEHETPTGGKDHAGPVAPGLQGRSATGLNGQAAKEEVSALWPGGWMPENISGVPAGRSVFHLTSPLIGLLAPELTSGLPVIRSGFPYDSRQWYDGGLLQCSEHWNCRYQGDLRLRKFPWCKP
jgi:hypothetical protein